MLLLVVLLRRRCSGSAACLVPHAHATGGGLGVRSAHCSGQQQLTLQLHS